MIQILSSAYALLIPWITTRILADTIGQLLTKLLQSSLSVKTLPMWGISHSSIALMANSRKYPTHHWNICHWCIHCFSLMARMGGIHEFPWLPGILTQAKEHGLLALVMLVTWTLTMAMMAKALRINKPDAPSPNLSGTTSTLQSDLDNSILFCTWGACFTNMLSMPGLHQKRLSSPGVRRTRPPLELISTAV